MPVVVVVLLVLGIFVVVVLVLTIGGLIRSAAYPRPTLADVSILGPCRLRPSSGVAAPTRALQPSDSDGIVRLVSTELPAGTTIDLTGSLRIETDNDLTIRGTINFSDRSAGGGGSVRELELISRTGVVTIGEEARILGGQAVDGTDDENRGGFSRASGSAGENGASIRIIGLSVIIDGTIVGDSGGNGGSGIARASGALGIVGSAGAAGGQGGLGGGVLICALEGIQLGPRAQVSGGTGGRGGRARADAKNGNRAEALGGPGAIGGLVRFAGFDSDLSDVPVIVLQGTSGELPQVTAGGGGRSGEARANGGSGSLGGSGGFAYAEAGEGGVGATVVFDRTFVRSRAGASQVSGLFRGGRGGPGGLAVAAGGGGDTGALLSGGTGGDAEGRGGFGGAPGVPIIPIEQPAGIVPSPGVVGAPGSGGAAFAVMAGDGGNPGRLAGRFGIVGGSSGTGFARGGNNGFGALPPGATPGSDGVTSAAVPGSATAGGIAAQVNQPGAP